MSPLTRLAAAIVGVAIVVLTALAPASAVVSEDLEDLVIHEIAGFDAVEESSGPLDVETLAQFLPNRRDAEALAAGTRAAYARVFVSTATDGDAAVASVVVVLFELSDGDQADEVIDGFVEGAQAKDDYAAFPVEAVDGAIGARFGARGRTVDSVAAPRPPFMFAVVATPAGDAARAKAIEVAIAQSARLDEAATGDVPVPALAADDGTDDGTGDGARGVGAAAATALLAGVSGLLVLTLARRRAGR